MRQRHIGNRRIEHFHERRERNGKRDNPRIVLRGPRSIDRFWFSLSRSRLDRQFQCCCLRHGSGGESSENENDYLSVSHSDLSGGFFKAPALQHGQARILRIFRFLKRPQTHSEHAAAIAPDFFSVNTSAAKSQRVHCAATEALALTGCDAGTAIPSPYCARPGIVTGSFPPIAISPNNALTAETSEGG